MELTLDEKLDLLLSRGLTRTRFSSVIVKSDINRGVPIGQGKCKAVILKANHFLTYETDPQLISNSGKFYYGDQQQQTKEYLVNTNTVAGDTNTKSSEIIFCKDLKDVWVRVCEQGFVPSAVLVTGIGAGIYTYSGIGNSGLPYYNLLGQPNNQDAYSILATDPIPDALWSMTANAGQINSSTTFTSPFPWLADWTGSTVTELTSLPVQLEIQLEIFD